MDPTTPSSLPPSAQSPSKSSSDPDPPPKTTSSPSSSSSSSSSSSPVSSRPPTLPTSSPPPDDPVPLFDPKPNLTPSSSLDPAYDSDPTLIPIPAKASSSSSPRPHEPTTASTTTTTTPSDPKATSDSTRAPYTTPAAQPSPTSSSSSSSSLQSTPDASSRRMHPPSGSHVTTSPHSTSPPPPEQRYFNVAPVQATSPPTPSHPPLTATPSFKSSLQVILKRQDEELVKNIEYKEQEEREKSKSREEGLESTANDEGRGKKAMTKEGDKENDEEKEKTDTVIDKEKGGERKDNKAKDSTNERKPSSEMQAKEDGARKAERRKEQEDTGEKKKADSPEKKTTSREVEEKRGEGKKERTANETNKERSRKKPDQHVSKPREEKEKSGERKEEKSGERIKEESGERKEEKSGERKEEKSGEGKEEKSGERSKEKSGEGSKEKSGERRESQSEEMGGSKHRDPQGKKREREKEGERKGERKKEEERKGERKERKMSKGKVDVNGAGVKRKESGTEEKRRKKGEDKSAEKKEGRTKDTEKRKKDKEGGKTVKAQGVLHIKKGERPFAWWKRYYCVLDGKLLTYYRSKQDYQALQGLKGSLDLAMLENIKVSKPGLMRSDFPFKLGRRNLSSVALAAETNEQREHWMEAMGELLHLTTSHSADSSPRKPSTTSEQTKFATLPHPSASKRHSSSSSSSEDERRMPIKEEKKEEDEEEKENEEEPHLIAPKKVPKVPIGVPLMKVNLQEVKLKKVDKRKEEEEEIAEEKAEVKKTGWGKSDSDMAKGGSVEKRTPSPEEMFGVKLKKIQPKKEGEGKEEASEGLKEENEGKKEGKGDATPTSVKRTIKQPVIPLNTTGLLSRSEVQSPKLSPTTQKRGNTERKKSPSPTIPISRSVQALTKSVEEVKASNNDALSNTTTAENGTSSADSKLKQKHSVTELKYCDVVSLNANNETVTPIPYEDEATMERHDSFAAGVDKRKERQGEVKETGADSKKSPVSPHPPVSVVLKSASDDELDHKDSDDNILKKKEAKDTEAQTNETTGTPQKEKQDEDLSDMKDKLTDPSFSPALSPSSNKFCTPSSHTSHDSPPSPAKSSSPTPPASTQGESDLKEFEEFNKTCLEMEKTSKSAPVSGEDEAPAAQKRLPQGTPTPPPSPRGRKGTNDSSGSSHHCEGEGADRRSGKFKLFKMKRSNSSVGKEKKDSGEEREPKDRKRRGSAFAKILHGITHKEKVRRPSEDGTEESAGEGAKEHQDHSTHPHPAPPLDQDVEPAAAKVEPSTPANQEEEDETQPPTKRSEDDLFKAVLESVANSGLDEIVLRRERSQSREGLRGSNYSYGSTSSREQEPAPSIPEKTRIREKSPIHDIPQSNRPVTNVHSLLDEEDGADEIKPVDGMISVQQIEDILSANETRDKRRNSQGRLHGPVLTVPNSDKGSMGQLGNDDNSRRPSYISLVSTESDEPLPTTNFLECDRRSSSSNSLKNRDSDSSGAEEQEPPPPIAIRKHSRPTESLTVGNRVSLTMPEFTVLEEDRAGSSDTEENKETAYLNTHTQDSTLNNDGDGNECGQSVDGSSENAQNKILTQETKNGQENKNHQSQSEDDSEKDERDDYFSVIGGGGGNQKEDEVLLRPSLSSATNPVRTSGIVGLREYLKEEQGEEAEGEVRSGISRLGHSVAVEKLKQTSEEL